MRRAIQTVLVCCCLGRLTGAEWQDWILAAEQDPQQIVATLQRLAALVPELPVAERWQVLKASSPWSTALFFSDLIVPEMQRLGITEHPVASGESPAAIMRRYQISDAWLKILNPRYDDRRLGAGQVLKVVDNRDATYQLLIDKSAYRCLLIRSFAGAFTYVAAWPVGIGTEERPTPEGVTEIAICVRDPEWTHPDTGQVIAAGDPANVLGGYWIGLQPGPEGRFRSIGLHGYTGAAAADWLEQAGSRGCLRLRQDDLAQLFAVARPGMRVQITP